MQPFKKALTEKENLDFMSKFVDNAEEMISINEQREQFVKELEKLMDIAEFEVHAKILKLIKKYNNLSSKESLTKESSEKELAKRYNNLTAEDIRKELKEHE